MARFKTLRQKLLKDPAVRKEYEALADEFALLVERNDMRLSDEQLAEIRRRRTDPNRKLVSHEEAQARIGRLGA